MNKVLIIVGDATETVDTLYSYYRLQEDDFEPVVAGPEKRRYHMVLHEILPDWDGNLVSGRTYHDHGRYVGVWIKMLIEARALAQQSKQA